jgi:hypothetical protein
MVLPGRAPTSLPQLERIGASGGQIQAGDRSDDRLATVTKDALGEMIGAEENRLRVEIHRPSAAPAALLGRPLRVGTSNSAISLAFAVSQVYLTTAQLHIENRAIDAVDFDPL